MLKKLTIVLVLALAFAGVAAAETMPLDQNYQGPFWVVSANDEAGSTTYKSVQAASEIATTADLQAVSIDWTEDKDGNITGSATFVSVNNKGTINVLLDGFSPLPEAGQDYRTASVNVTFNGGTGAYEGATGKAHVNAKLTLDGISAGRIVGEINVP